MKNEQYEQRCLATTKAGERCKRWPRDGEAVCASHKTGAFDAVAASKGDPDPIRDGSTTVHGDDSTPAADAREVVAILSRGRDRARPASPGPRPGPSPTIERTGSKDSHPLFWIIAALLVLGAIVGQGSDESSTDSTGASVGYSSLCETNWQQRDPYISSNNHAEFIRNCEAGSELLKELTPIIHGDA